MQVIAGIDEVGRGPLAGPVVAAAVVLPPEYTHPEITDSKKLSAQKRETLAEVIQSESLDWSIVSLSPRVIDELNILEATRYAMAIALQFVQATEALIDGNTSIKAPIPQKTVIGGDAKHIEIAAASIIAKVWRDQLMKSFAERFPEYGFCQNAGYPTKSHRQAIMDYGICSLHRLTFQGVAQFSDKIHPSDVPYPFEDIVVHQKGTEYTFSFFGAARRKNRCSVSRGQRV